MLIPGRLSTKPVYYNEVLNSAISFLESKSKVQRKEEDTEEKFGKYIASELRNIKNERSRQIVKFKIQQIIMMEQIGTAQDNQRAMPVAFSHPYQSNQHGNLTTYYSRSYNELDASKRRGSLYVLDL